MRLSEAAPVAAQLPLSEVVAGRIWEARQKVKLGPLEVFTRMTVVRLGDGGLWVHSPVAPAPQLVAALAALGAVRHVVAPNNSHHLHFRAFLEAFPAARGYLSAALAARRPELTAIAHVGPMTDCWLPDLRGFFIDGLPQLDETVWFHEETGTLIVADLLFCFAAERSWLVRQLARLLGVHRRLAMSRTLKALVKDRAALLRSANRLLSLDVRRVILAHELIVAVDAREWLRDAFGWLAS